MRKGKQHLKYTADFHTAAIQQSEQDTENQKVEKVSLVATRSWYTMFTLTLCTLGTGHFTHTSLLILLPLLCDFILVHVFNL